MKEILIADDELAMRRAYRAMFESEGYAVRLARNGDEALAAFAERRPDLVLLDVMMPGRNGIAVCEEMRRADKAVPILFFTAAPSEASLVRGLGLGADDYVDKAVGREVLLARVRSAIARREALSAAAPGGDVLELAGVRVDFAAMAASGDGVDAELTKSEVLVLRRLAESRGEVVSNDRLFAALRGECYLGDDRAMRKLVQRLREKLGRAGSLVVNERGAGYKLVR